MVADFHRKFNVPIGTVPKISRPLLRANLIREEAAETITAIESNDIVEVADGLCDLIYVALGAALEFGIDLAPLFDEVHRSNMEKVGGDIRSDGKILKPDGWKPPRIRELLWNQTSMLDSLKGSTP
jgi:predicted HAD superfamily Cof-like phosphohydrolase